MQSYHDDEWGRSEPTEQAYFERLTLEAFQSGLSWATILAKRPRFREVFAEFDVDAIADFGPTEEEALMADAGIVRNRLKVTSTIRNAQATVALRDSGGLVAFVDQFRPPVAPPYETTLTAESQALSKALKKAGFAFVGPTTMHALMQALGLFNPHHPDCYLAEM
ncbi:DNA-3-methyladenine glycosylase I [Nocardioides baekrokdamisoli]|nr:DNA-3-methyladenine glycosylase I [Nocardioides baekrokdamisoli]